MGTTELLNQASDPESFWSTTNLAEAIPGVSTPLNWTLWGPTIESNTRRIFNTLGVLPKGETVVPDDPRRRAYGVFHGRPAFRVDFFCQMGDRLPGTDGRAVAHQLMSHVPPDFRARPARRYYPWAAVRLPWAFVKAVRLTRSGRADVDRWWRESVRAVTSADEVRAIRVFAEAVDRFRDSLFRHGLSFFVAVQPVYDLLSRFTANTAVSAEQLMKGYGGHEEISIIHDLWDCSRNRLDLETFVDRHGYHGSREGQVSATVWREDPRTVVELIKRYGSMHDDRDPARASEERIRARERLEREFLASLPARKRLTGRGLLRLARLCIPLRGVNKVAFVQSLDVARAAAKRLGDLLAQDGRLARSDDIFFLTVDEILSGAPDSDSAELIRIRHAQYEGYRQVELPGCWQGIPSTAAATTEQLSDQLQGIAASPGTVEGIARVVLDPADVDGRPGEILVAHTTDPSWASVMFLSAALVTDIGGLLSHTAIVARELGIPCVVDTQQATAVIRSGDRCRVDGSTGRVTVLRRRRSGDPTRGGTA